MGGPAPALADGPESHLVARGETLYRIAKTYSVPLETLMSANGLSTPDIKAGQLLRLPQASVPSPQTPSTPTDSTTYTVAAGENLFRIAQRVGSTVPELMALNGLSDPNRIFAGQVLRLPQGSKQPTAQEQPAVTSAQPIPPTQPLQPFQPPQEPSAALHQVAPGENLFRISLRYGVTMEALARANGLANPDALVVGRVLVIPTSSNTAIVIPVQPPQTSRLRVTVNPGDLFRLTHYCLVGPMSSGRWVYWGAAAADQSVFNLGTRLRIEGRGDFVVEDRFAWDGAEKRLDLWVPSCDQAIQLGVEFRRVWMLSAP